jgi:hypothetical protein
MKKLAYKKAILLYDIHPFKKNDIVEILKDIDNYYIIRIYGCLTCQAFEISKHMVFVEHFE